MIIINNWETDENFWQLYPELKLALSFKDIYKSDKSRNKESSSKLMWFVALTTALNSKYINIPQDERYEVIGEDFMENKHFLKDNKVKLEKLIEDFKKISDTPAQRHLRQWLSTIDDRTKFLTTAKYDLDNYDKLDKMAANTAALMTTFKKINDDLIKEASGGGDVKGGGRESLNDTGDI